MRGAARKIVFSAVLFCGLSACNAAEVVQSCEVEFIILGTAQDAGMPQIGNNDDPAWQDMSLKGYATSAALVNHQNGARYLFEATPDMREQINRLDEMAPPKNEASLGLSGIFLTHAHMGHYARLMFVGHESAGAKGINVYAMPRMSDYLQNNGPWSQLVEFGNITLQPLTAAEGTRLPGELSVTPYQVPHRDEFSETVGFEITGGDKAVLFLPDIDSWDEWEKYGQTIEARLAAVDYAFLDATFYDDNELPGRDMSAIPHPRLKGSMDRFDDLATSERDKVRFIHLNHTNPARFEDSAISKEIARRGYKLAKEGESYCLDN